MKAIQIGSRREVCWDEFLIESSEGVGVKMHTPEYKGVALTLNKAWEGNGSGGYGCVRTVDGKIRLYYRGFTFPSDKREVHKPVWCLAQSDDGKCALALKRNPGGADMIWSALPLLNGEIVQALAEKCSLPVVKCSPQVPVWFNRGVLAVHTAKAAKVSFDFRKFPLELREWDSAKSVPLNCKRSLPKESTWLLDMNWKDQQ